MDVFDLMATIDLDASKYEQGLNDAETKGKGFGQRLKDGLGTAGKVASVALGAAATAVGFMTKSAVSGFAEQQQLVGGVQKLYGNAGMSVQEYAKSVGKSVQEASGEWKVLEAAQNEVLKNANNAYATAGMSANQYMETATSFSAALINSLGGDTMAAAQQTDVAMRAISDNFNTFGGDIGMVQGAFQGFAKSNFTMLDNLKLGYGGTKQEMERLIQDANEYAAANGQAADLSIDSFSDIVTAIDLIQQKQGIAGTTAAEASRTVEGSLNMLKGAWDNLLAGLGDGNADIGALVDNVVSSAETVMTNVLPVIENALSGIGDLITRVAPIISEKLPTLISTILPPLIQAATQLVAGLVAALPTIIQALVDAIPMIVQTIVSYDWASIATQIVQALIAGFQSVIGLLGITGDMTVTQILDRITSLLGRFLSKGAELVGKLASGIVKNAPQALSAFGSVVMQILAYIGSHLAEFLSNGLQVAGNFAMGIIQNIPNAVSAMGTGISQIVQKIVSSLPQFLQNGIKMLGQIASGIGQGVSRALSAIAGAISSMIAKFTGTNWASIGSNIMSGIANGIRAGLSAALNAMASAVQTILSRAKSALGINSPSKVFRKIIGLGIDEGIAKGIEDGVPLVNNAMDDLNDDLVTGFGGFGDVGFGDSEVVTTIRDDSKDAERKGSVVNYFTFNANGTENPEQFADRALRQVRLRTRMA